MSYEQVDRLSDEFWTQNELTQMHKAVINPSRYDKTPKHICWYHLLKEGEYTGKAMLLAVESIVDGQDAVNNALADVESSVTSRYSQQIKFRCYTCCLRNTNTSGRSALQEMIKCLATKNGWQSLYKG